MLEKLRRALEKEADPERAAVLSGFFKTGKGQYGEGDVFLGVTVPALRRLTRNYSGLSLFDVKHMLSSRVHEERLVRILILVAMYKKSDGREKERIAGFYLRNLKGVNNWNLVDLTAQNILGDYLLENPGERGLLRKLAKGTI